jgi:malate permease and related proteins
MAVTSLLGLLGTIVNVVLPVFLIAGVGFTVRRALDIDPRPIGRLGLYVLVPSLLFNSMLTAKMGGDEIVRIGIYAVVLTFILIVIGFTSGAIMRLKRAEASALTLALTFMNAVNYGLPVNLFAFGQEGFDRAAVFAVFETTLTFSLAVFVAARGNLPWREALLPLLKMPVLWAAAAGITLRALGVELPLPLQRAVTILSGAAVPVVILMLGMQMATLRPHRIGRSVLVAAVGRLGLAPAIGLLLVALLSPEPLTAKVLVLEAAMPTSVNVTLLATEFDTEPDLVATVAVLTTLASILTISLWVMILQRL